VIDAYLGSTPAVIFTLLALLLLPATLMILIHASASHSTRQPLTKSPTWSKIIERMKWSYLGVSIYPATSFITVLIFSDFAMQHLPTVFGPTLTAALFTYVSFALFALIAYVLKQNNSFQADDKHKKMKPSNKTSHNSLYDKSQIIRLDADLDIALKTGEFNHAITLLDNELKRNNQSDLRRHQLYQLLSVKNDLKQLERYAHLFLQLMDSRGDIKTAAEFIERLRGHNPEFQLHDLALSLSLCEQFQKHKIYPLVLWLAKDAHTRFDPEPMLAELYLRAAKTLLSKYKNQSKAQHYLDYIQQHFPDQAIAESARILQDHIQKTQVTR